MVLSVSLVLVLLAAAVAVAVVVAMRRRAQKVAVVKSLFLYPVKSCRYPYAFLCVLMYCRHLCIFVFMFEWYTYKYIRVYNTYISRAWGEV